MRAMNFLLASGIAASALVVGTPAAAQYYPGYGYGYGNPYARPGSQMVVNECAGAAQSRLSGGYGASGYGARVLGISRVGLSGNGGMTVSGVASSGRFAGYGYDAQRPDLIWRCSTDFRGVVIGLDIYPAQPAYGVDYNDNYNTAPWNDYSQYGYVRY